jgi:hypothetical protein
MANGLVIQRQESVTICWRLKGQKGVTLSSSKAGYVRVTKAVEEIHFIDFLLKGMVFDVKLSIIVR